MKEITVYVQSSPMTNGVYPVYKYRRDTEGRWHFGFCQKDKDGKPYFEEHDVTFELKSQEWNDRYYIRAMSHKALAYMFTERFDSREERSSEVTLDGIRRMIEESGK